MCGRWRSSPNERGKAAAIVPPGPTDSANAGACPSATLRDMAAFLLDAFVFLEVAVIAASLIWISRTAESQPVRAILPMVAALLLIITIASLFQIKGDGSGLYVIGLVPFSLIILFPVAAITFAGAAWYWSRKKTSGWNATRTASRRSRGTRNSAEVVARRDRPKADSTSHLGCWLRPKPFRCKPAKGPISDSAQPTLAGRASIHGRAAVVAWRNGPHGCVTDNGCFW